MEDSIKLFEFLGGRISRRAADALSHLLGIKVKAEYYVIYIVEPEKVVELLNTNSSTVVGVISRIEGENQGYLVFLVNLKHAEQILSLLLNQHLGIDFNKADSSIKIDALKEVTNIVIGNLVSEISDTLKRSLSYTIPEAKFDYLPALIDPICIDLTMCGSKVTMIEIKLSSEIGALSIILATFLMTNGGI